ncbi:hypothetical protein ISP15_16105 [Dyella jejuensis]|uniref:Uncharacterized protein n=1 Tax=Dyella jejuensis TaxID=1432009 RepID=A0ABW8JL72_9GAMM
MSIKKSNIKIPLFLKIFIGIAWLSLFIFIIRKNPSAKTTALKLNEMQKEADLLLKNGGDVVFSNDLSKYGVSSLLRGISFSSLTDDIYKKDINYLASNGWDDKGSGAFCKGGIFLQFNRRAVFFKGIATVELHMDYSAKSIRECK